MVRLLSRASSLSPASVTPVPLRWSAVRLFSGASSFSPRVRYSREAQVEHGEVLECAQFLQTPRLLPTMLERVKCGEVLQRVPVPPPARRGGGGGLESGARHLCEVQVESGEGCSVGRSSFSPASVTPVQLRSSAVRFVSGTSSFSSTSVTFVACLDRSDQFDDGLLPRTLPPCRRG